MKRVYLSFNMKPLGQYNLENIPGPNIFLAFLHIRDKLFLCQVGTNITKSYFSRDRPAIEALPWPFLLKEIRSLVKLLFCGFISSSNVLIFISILNMNVSHK
ncbi:hypothetical protein D1872_233290 [compost metagenome]